MLNGIDPIIIFQFSKILPSFGAQLAKIPLVSQIPSLIEAPPIPIYLSEALTGLCIDSESRSIEIETNIETKTDASTPDVNQKGLSETVSIQLTAKKTSLGLTLLSAMAGLILDRATSKEYAITYMHGPITVFRGLLHSFSIDQNADSELLNIKIELSRGPTKTPQKPVGPPSVTPIANPVML